MKINPELKIDLILLRKQRNTLADLNNFNDVSVYGTINLLEDIIDGCLDKVEALVKVYDIGPGKQVDRYTAVYTTPQPSHRGVHYNLLGMSDNPSHPLGVGMHDEISYPPSEWSYLGELISFTDLPEACQVAVLNDLEEELS